VEQIAVSDRGTLRALTRFPQTLDLGRGNLLNANEIDEQPRKSLACAIISVGLLANG
jgi:hypothetical protein